VLDAVISRIGWADVDVALVADDAARQLDHAGRTHQPATGRVAVVAALAHRHVQAEGDGVGESQLHLAMVAARTENSQVGDHPVPWTDNGHGLLGREEAVLVQRLVGRQLVALAEQALQVLLRDVAVPRRYVHDQFRRSTTIHRALAGVALEGFTHEALYQATV